MVKYHTSNNNIRKIQQTDIDKIKEIYGENGFLTSKGQSQLQKSQISPNPSQPNSMPDEKSTAKKTEVKKEIKKESKKEIKKKIIKKKIRSGSIK